jgi:Fe-S cluster biogenesis protein NfuA
MMDLQARIINRDEAEAILDRRVRPAIRGHAGDIRLVDISDQGEIAVEFSGACQACPLRPVTFATAVQPAFSGIAGVAGVRCESVRMSPHAMRRMAQMMQPRSQ